MSRSYTMWTMAPDGSEEVRCLICDKVLSRSSSSHRHKPSEIVAFAAVQEALTQAIQAQDIKCIERALALRWVYYESMGVALSAKARELDYKSFIPLLYPLLRHVFFPDSLRQTYRKMRARLIGEEGDEESNVHASGSDSE